MRLEDLEVLINAEEIDDYSSWVSTTSYRSVLEKARTDCPKERHIVNLYEYVSLWMETVKHEGSRACNEADVWLRFKDDKNLKSAVSKVRHPFKSTVLVDTYLTEFSYAKGIYEALVIANGKPQERIVIPVTGKIYEVNEYGIPTKTGGKKIAASDDFEHRWWLFHQMN